MSSDRKCCVPNCSNTWDLTKNKVYYYRFPLNEKMKQNWLEAMNWREGKPNRNDFVCSDHFESKDLTLIDESTSIVPTIFKPEFVAIKTESGFDSGSNIITISSEAFLNAEMVKKEIDDGDDIELGRYEIIDVPLNEIMQMQSVKEEIDDDDIELECYQIVNSPDVSDNEPLSISMAKKPKLEEIYSSSETSAPSDEEMQIMKVKSIKNLTEQEVPLIRTIKENISKARLNVVPALSDGSTNVKAVANQSIDILKHNAVRINPDQKKLLIDFIELNFQDLFGFGNCANPKKVDLWKQISTDLNNVDKQNQRSVDQWKRTWQDLKTNIKKKLKKLREARINMEEIPDNLNLNSDEKRIVEICGLANFDGCQTVPETGVYDAETQSTTLTLIQSTPSATLSPSSLQQLPQPGSSEAVTQLYNMSESAVRSRMRRARLNEILPPRGPRHRENDPRIDGVSVASVVRQLELQETTVELLHDIKSLLTQLVNQGSGGQKL